MWPAQSAIEMKDTLVECFRNGWGFRLEDSAVSSKTEIRSRKRKQVLVRHILEVIDLSKVGFAVVGCGSISKAHIHAIHANQRATLSAVVDIVPERAKAVAEKNNCLWFSSIEEMLAKANVDVVNICTASGLHMEPALIAAQAGKHLMIEKPLEVTRERCDAIISACEEHNVLLGGIFQCRFFAANQLVKQAVAEGKFGQMVLGNAFVKWYRPPSYYAETSWRGTRRFDGGGALMNQAIHHVDLLQWIMGQVTSVQAFSDRLLHKHIEVEDAVTAILRFASGAMGILQASTAVQPGYPKRLEIHGTMGGAILEDDLLVEQSGLKIDPKTEAAINQHAGGATHSDPTALSYLGHELQISDFIEALCTGREPAVSGREARKAVDLVLAIYEAAESGQMVRLTHDG